MNSFSDNPLVNKFASDLINAVGKPNPLHPDQQIDCLDQVKALVRMAFGDNEARKVRIPVH